MLHAQSRSLAAAQRDDALVLTVQRKAPTKHLTQLDETLQIFYRIVSLKAAVWLSWSHQRS